MLELEVSPNEYKCLRISPLFLDFHVAEGELILPNIDVALAHELPNPTSYVQEWSEKGWLSNAELFGPLGQGILDAIADEKDSDEYKEASENQKRVCEFATFLGYVDPQFQPRNLLAWMGSPAVIEQALTAVQAQIALRARDWDPPI